jgi:hypothetical protein
MKIIVYYLVDGIPRTSIIDQDCSTKEQAGRIAIDYAKEKGSRHFPHYTIREESHGNYPS